MTEDADATAEERTDDAEAGVDAPERTDAEDDVEDAAEVGTENGVDNQEEADAETAPEGDAASTNDAADGAEPEAAEKPLVERVAENDEELAAELREERAAYEERIDDLESKLTRKQADFQNFKKRQQKKLADQQARATEDLVERLLPVRDNLARALEQEGDADIREGVEKTLAELDRVLDDEGVDRIEPAPGEAPDPERHEVLMRVESDRPAGVIDELYRPGYEMGDRVIRTAQVTVSQE